MFVRHKVEDYAKWRSVYDAFDATRRSVGVKAQSVCRAVGNPSDVTVTHDFDTAEKAKAFVESSELHKRYVQRRRRRPAGDLDHQQA
jgi:hypothetical protein